MNNWEANHYVLSYGHIGAELLSLASMLRIPACMNNGLAEFRACSNYRPVYG